MTHSYLHYDLQDGYVHNWLVLGPRVAPMGDGGPDGFLDVASDPVVQAEAVEPSAVDDGIVAFDDFEGTWRYVRCSEDHFVDLSEFTGGDQQLAADRFLVAWAYAELEVPTACTVSGVLTTAGPRGAGAADVWVNRQQVHHAAADCRAAADCCQEDGRALFGAPASAVPSSERFCLSLDEGRNSVLIRFKMIATDPCAYAIALHAGGAVATVCLPTSIAPIGRRELLERVFYAAYTDRYVLAREDEVSFGWPSKDDPYPTFDESVSMMARLRALSGGIYAETDRTATAGSRVRMGHAYQQLGGAFNVILMPRAQEFYTGGMRISRALPLWSLGNNRYSGVPTGTFAERHRETLISAARRETNVYSEIAKMAVGWWSRLDLAAMLQTLDALRTSPERDYRELLGFLGMAMRFGDAPEFPATLTEAIAATTVEVTFSDEWFSAESDALARPEEFLVAACAILAGQIHPEYVWAATGRTGQWILDQGERLALAWMHACAAKGLHAWQSDTVFEDVIAVLAHLIDLADNEEIWQTASVLLDKLLFQLSVNSFQGVFGSSRGTTSTPHLFGGYLEATSGISRLMWGMGVCNHNIRAAVSLACLENYQYPAMLQAIAADLPPDGMWSLECHVAGDAVEGVSTATYKTPDGMLSAALDYRPGEPGAEEHIWQATLGPGATVFVTHPVCSSLDDARRPNFWRGNGMLPRVAQWHDALIALYALPDADWMGFTHAYFPVYAFDEYALREGWAFARKGDGYVALTADVPLTLIRGGDAAYRELRAYGRHVVWLCQMGRAAEDGDFAAFQEKVLALPAISDDLSVRWTTLRGDTLSFDWTGPFLKNDEPLSLTVENLMENPYCVAAFPAEMMDIRYGDVVMRLDFTG